MRCTLLKKIVPLALVSAMLLSAVSCRKRSTRKEGRKISSDDPWFDAEVFNIKPDIDLGGVTLDYREQRSLGADDKYIVVLSKAYFEPEEVTDDNDLNFVTVIDRNTKDAINTIDLNQYRSHNGYIKDVKYLNGKITATYCKNGEFGSKFFDMDFDAMTGEILDERDHSGDEMGSFMSSVFHAGKYTVLAEEESDDKTRRWCFLLGFFSSEGEEHHVKIQKKDTDFSSIPIVLPLSEDKVLVPAFPYAAELPLFFEVDIRTEKVVEVDGKDYEWIDFDSIRGACGGRDGQTYFSTNVGISKIDLKNKRIDEFFSYDACLFNHEHLSNSEMVNCSDGNIVLLGGHLMGFSFEDSVKPDFDIIVLTRASENPNAGKTVLDLYSANGYVDQTVSDAIVTFNKTNRDYFIEITGRYEYNWVMYHSATDTEDDIDNELLQRNLSLTDMLAMDIISGTGPDILIINDDMGRLNYPDYLIDLNKYFGDLDPEKYFTNIVDAARTDDKLYQMPITFSIEGIHTDSKYAGASGVGFTTAEYEDFLYGPLNGKDLNRNGQAMYFATLFNAMSEEFIVNGKADFSGPEFAELADFVKKNVPEESAIYGSEAEGESNDAMSDYVDQIARLTTLSSPLFYLYSVSELHGARAILGIPSTDGRGPLIRTNCSAAVSAQAVNPDACAEFIRILLSDEIQNELGNEDSFTISREAFKKASGNTLDYFNGAGGDSYYQGLGDPSGYRLTFTEDDMAELEKIIMSCSHFVSEDASIKVILIEEMPPYFLGQKDLPEVVKILQDRVQKVLDERG